MTIESNSKKIKSDGRKIKEKKILKKKRVVL
jgi:hypothetical protein